MRARANAGGSRRLRFWFEEPLDLSGVVFRIRDQVLVPDLPIDTYRTRFAERVREADARREAQRRERGTPSTPPEVQAESDAWYARMARCHEDPSRVECFDPGDGGMPPPPREEERPPAPAGDVEWVPGYWVYNSGLNDFLWLAGTYVARAAPPAAPGVLEEAPPPPTASPEPASAQPLPPSLAPAPAPRAEVIPPPPPTARGALWVAGYFRLEGGRWVWTRGAWRVPPRAGMRHRAPVVRTQGEVRIYLPGGWLQFGR